VNKDNYEFYIRVLISALVTADLFGNTNKSIFGVTEVELLSFIIIIKVVEIKPDKVVIIKN
jgi:hypothetical protein